MSDNQNNNDTPQYMCTALKDGKVCKMKFAYCEYEVRAFRAWCRLNGFGYEILNVGAMKKKKKEKPVVEEPVIDSPAAILQRKKWAKKVICEETGKVYETVSDLQREIGWRRWALEYRIKNVMEIDGKHYKFLED